jgi:hypothetical protein
MFLNYVVSPKIVHQVREEFEAWLPVSVNAATFVNPGRSVSAVHIGNMLSATTVITPHEPGRHRTGQASFAFAPDRALLFLSAGF